MKRNFAAACQGACGRGDILKDCLPPKLPAGCDLVPLKQLPLPGKQPKLDRGSAHINANTIFHHLIPFPALIFIFVSACYRLHPDAFGLLVLFILEASGGRCLE